MAVLEGARSKGKDKLKDRLAKRRASTVPVPVNENQFALKRSPRGSPPTDVLDAAQSTKGSEHSGSPRVEGQGQEGKKDEGKKESHHKKKKEHVPSGFSGESMKLIEGKLDRIERVIQALEKRNAALVLTATEDHAASMNARMQADIAAAAAMAVISEEQEDDRIDADKEKDNAPIISYRDKDEPATFSEKVVPMGEEDMSITEKAKVEYGKTLAGLLGLESLAVKVATQLPPSHSTGNAFSNSYRYERENDTLFIHSQRLGSSGDFGLMVVHALSHIKVRQVYIVYSVQCTVYSVQCRV